MRAISHRDPSYSATVADATTVNYAPSIVWDGPIAHDDVVPPATLIYTHWLTNAGNADDIFDLGVDAPPGIIGTPSVPALTINRGASASFVVTSSVGPITRGVVPSKLEGQRSGNASRVGRGAMSARTKNSGCGAI